MIHFNFTLFTLTPNSKLISTLKTFNKHQLAQLSLNWLKLFIIRDYFFVIDIDWPPLPPKNGLYSSAYAQFSWRWGGAWVQTRSVIGEVHKHIFPSTLSTGKGSEESFKV